MQTFVRDGLITPLGLPDWPKYEVELDVPNAPKMLPLAGTLIAALTLTPFDPTEAPVARAKMGFEQGGEFCEQVPV